MKKLLVVLLIIAIALGGAYFWWQRNASRLITTQVQAMAKNFFVNPEVLTISPEKLAVKMRGLQTAVIPQVVIEGKDVQMRKGPRLASVKLDMRNLEVTTPPFRLSKIERGWFVASITDEELTAYLHKRGGSIAGLSVIPLDSINVSFVDASLNTVAQAKAKLRPGVLEIPLTARGVLVASGQAGSMNKIDFQIKKIDGVPNMAIDLVAKSLAVINPVFNMSDWPIETNIEKITITKGMLTVRGTVKGVTNQSLMPN